MRVEAHGIHEDCCEECCDSNDGIEEKDACKRGCISSDPCGSAACEVGNQYKRDGDVSLPAR